MKLSASLSERAARLSYALLFTLHLLVLASLLWAISAVAARAQGEPSCGGRDLLASLAESDPARFAALKAEAAQVPNGQGVLWRIEKEGGKPSFLFGTMHLSDPRVLDLSPAVWSALDEADTVAIETTDMLDQKKIAAAMMSDPALTMFTDGTTLFSLVSPEDRKVLEDGLKRIGIPPFSVSKMKPWVLATVIAIPPCERARQASGARVLDLMVAEEAAKAEKPVVGLESAADQIRAMTSLPMEYHLSGLIESLRLGEGVEDVFETMIVMYEAGEMGMFGPGLKALFPGALGDLNQHGFQERIIDARNVTMAKGAVPLIEAGGAFIAVGALHLPGEKGLVSLLREKGYAIAAVE
ncbi:MAG: polysaccharide biosynthesis protein GumN [Mesorhizobium amorphae]|nr:MAG: polysaccharide biosynthesis protein GumN [Mesorhizobium amorphae]